MVASVQTPSQLVHLALRRVGSKLRIGNLYDGSPAAKVALDLYAQTRDALLRQYNDWGFSERTVVATLLKSAPEGGYIPPNVWNPATNPPPRWMYEYSYPADMIAVRAVRPTPLFVLDFDPQPVVFEIANDNAFAPPQRVILAQIPSAMLVYTAQITDLTTWEPDAIEAFAAALGRRLAPSLVGLEGAKLAAADEAQAGEQAMQEDG